MMEEPTTPFIMPRSRFLQLSPGTSPSSSSGSSSVTFSEAETVSIQDPRSPLISEFPPMDLTRTYDNSKKGDRVEVVADIWHKEEDAHFEWEILFAPGDVDIGTIRTSLRDGHFVINVPRVRPPVCPRNTFRW
ncbi:unnamed protein product [Somion occarium]|uniref:Uncharacterized protein n=1 Tax=Somion occarium TaxID=3059160 RepID=A0ABP1ED96_9APHY